MEKRLSYTVVGAFVIIITLSLFFFLYWLTKYGNESVKHDYYKTYFTESVSGLSLDSPVKLTGVEVGQVKKISINKKNSEEVEVLLQIKKGTPIKKDTYATLDTQGITGLMHIELKGGSQNSPLLTSKNAEIAVIPSKKSILATLYDSSESIIKKISSVSDKVNLILSEKNMNNFSRIVANLSNTTDYIDNNKQKISQMFDQINELKINIENNLNTITKNISVFTDDSKDFLNHTKSFEDTLIPTFNKLGRMSDRVGDASDTTKEFFYGIKKELINGEFNIADIVRQNMQIINETALSLRNLSFKLDALIGELKNSPSDILYKSSKKIPGPGESHE